MSSKSPTVLSNASSESSSHPSDGYIIGVDEVGRGALVGKVVVAALLMPYSHPIGEQVSDSKKLTPLQRERFFELISSQLPFHHIASANAQEVDQYNIHHATLLAMQRAIEALLQQLHTTQPQLLIKTTHILVDGKFVPRICAELQSGLSMEAIPQGDDSIPAISAASILAKVVRDRQMLQLDQQFPQYGFARHKGYPTKEHLQAIKQHGILEQHRRSYKPIKELLV